MKRGEILHTGLLHQAGQTIGRRLRRSSWNSQVVSFQELWSHGSRKVQTHDCRHSGCLLHLAVYFHHRRATVSVVKETRIFPPLPSALIFVFQRRCCRHMPSNSPLHTPVDCGVVHLVDQDYQVLDAGRLGQHGVLPCLTALLEARLELAFPRRDDLRAKHIPSWLEMAQKNLTK